MKIECPLCKTKYEVEESVLGQKVECPCGTSWIVRDFKEDPPPSDPEMDIEAIMQQEREEIEREIAQLPPAAVTQDEIAAKIQKAQAQECLQHEIICPRCRGTNIHTDTKGFSIKKAAVGAILIGPIGLIGGAIGAKDIQFTCLSCQNKFSLSEMKTFQAEQQKLANMEISEIIEKKQKDDAVVTAVLIICGICILAFIIFILIGEYICAI